MKPLGKVRIKWSPEFAYAIGLLTTDGNLSSDRRHINFTSKDRNLVKIFSECLKIKNKIRKKTRAREKIKKYFEIQFGDVIFYKFLLSIGLIPHKSKRIRALMIPDKYFFDFLRGCFDGDGTCYSYRDPRWLSSFMFYVAFTSGSLSFLEWLRNKLKYFLKIHGHITKQKRAWNLCFAKRKAKILISRMYYKNNLPLLKRKYKKLKNILDIDNKEIAKSLNERVLELVDS